MARRGRPRKNTTPVATAANGPAGTLEKPETIAVDSVASAEWDRVTDLLGPLATPADVGALVSYCAAFGLVVHARRELAPKNPDDAWILTTTTAAGTPKIHPLVTQLNSALRDLAKFADLLGLTPTARARVGQTAAPAEDAFDEFLRSRIPKA